MKLKKYLEEESMEDDAYEYAKKAHEGAKRKGGDPYIIHPERVMRNVEKYKGNSSHISELKAAAALHDTLEDDPNTNEEILKSKFGDLVSSLVKELTSDKEEQNKIGKSEYLTKKILGMTNYALVLKLCDRLDNVSDLNSADKKFREKYKKETEFILNNLEEKRELTKTQKKIVQDIRDMLKEIK